MSNTPPPPESVDPLSRFWRALTRPPYKGVPWVVFLYVLVSCLVYTDNGPFTGHIVGFDDQVRMTQVLQWVNGGAWYDRMITRVDSPEGFQTIWARIVDLPIAAVIIVAERFVDQRTAALIASVIVPMIELGLMFLTARYLARPIAGKREAWLVILFVMFTTVLNHKTYTLAGFHLGEASHHAWYGILNVLMFGAAVRIVMGVPGLAPRLMLGLAMALLLAVGIEGFPIIAAVIALVAILSWASGNRRLAMRGAEAVGVGALLSLFLLPMHVPSTQWLDVSYSQPSIIGPALLAAAALFLLLQSFVMQKINYRPVSGIALIVLAGLFAYGLIQVFPGMLAGATSGLSPHERELAAAEHPEVWTMFRVATDTVDYIGLIMPTLIALVAGVAGMATTGNTRRRMMYATYTGFALVTGVLAQVFWRYFHHALTAACPLLLYAWQRLRAHMRRTIHYSLASFAVFVALGPFWMVYLPALDVNAPFLTQVVFFPAKIYTEPYSCNTLSMTDYLNRHYPPNTNLNVPDWDTASFLYETDLHIDFLSNYPSHDHFVDNKAFFQTQDVNVARQIAARHGFDLVAVCSIIPMSPAMAATRPYRQPSMIERLKEGSQPSWLKPVPTGIETNYLLFAVDHAALSAPPDKGH